MRDRGSRKGLILELVITSDLYCSDVATAQIRCKGRGSEIETPAKFAEAEKYLLFVVYVAYFACTLVCRGGHFGVIIIGMIGHHEVAPALYCLPFKLFILKSYSRHFDVFNVPDEIDNDKENENHQWSDVKCFIRFFFALFHGMLF